MRGGATERGFRRSSERSEGEGKTMKVVTPRPRPRGVSRGEDPGGLAGNGKKVMRGAG
jgi:hypothetical protein